MDRPRLEIDTESAFGTYPLNHRQRLARDLIVKSRSKRVINLLRIVGGLASCKVADVKVYGSQMRLYPKTNRSDKVMLARPHVFDRREREALAAHLGAVKNPSFIDIGANIGAYSIYVQSLRLDTKIIAIEADKEIFKRLQFNLPGETKLNIAVASEEGVISFYINEASRGENSLVQSEGMKKIEVPAKTLLQILDENDIEKPSAIKIDVEGAEMDILRKFYDTAPQERWPELVLMECFHANDVVEMMLARGYGEVLRTKMNIVLKLQN